MNARIRALEPYPMVELARRKEALRQQGVEVLDFGTGDPREPTPEIIRKAFKEATPEVSQYPTVAGHEDLRRVFAGWYQRRFGVELDVVEGILPVRGSKEAMFHLPLALLDPESERRTVIYPEPGYPVMEIGSLYAQGERHRYPLTVENGYLMDPSTLPADLLDRTAIVWISYPHNPTGTDLPPELFEAWVAARERHGFVLCSDECYTEIWFGDERPKSLLEFGMEGCLAFHSLSKRSGMTGYRSGMVAGDPELVGWYRQCRAGMGQAMPIMAQAASKAAWADEKHVEERRRIFGQKRRILLEGLTKLGLTVWPAASTFYLWIRVPEGHTGQSYAHLLLDQGIVVSPGSFFGEGNEDWFRIALVPSPEGCTQALDRWPRP